MTSVNKFQILLLVLLMWTSDFKTCSSQETNTTDYDHYDYNADYNDSNYTTMCEKSSNRHFRSWFIPTFYSIICFLGLAGNILVIATFIHFKRLKTMTDVYLLNLAFADLFFAMSLPFWAASSISDWVFGLVLCKAMHTIYRVSFYSSMLLLSFISMDRYFAINKAVTAHRHRSQAVYVSKVSSVVIWIVALILSAPEMKYATIINDTSCEPYNSYSDPLHIIQTSQLVLGFVIPLLVMGFCYSAIVKTLCQARNLKRNKAIKVIFAVVAVFLLCQVPYNLVVFLETAKITVSNGTTEVCDNERKHIFAIDVTQCVAFFRCCLNPFVYAFIGVKFRHDLLKLLKDWGCMSQEQFSRHACGSSWRRSSAATDSETISKTQAVFELVSR